MTDIQQEIALRKQLIKHLKGGEAFVPVDKLLDQIPYEETGTIVHNLPYSLYQQFYHLKVAQYDIIQFSLDPQYTSPDWPEGYWPKEKQSPNENAWKDLQQSYFADRGTWCDYLLTAENSIMEPIPHADGQTLLRETLLIIEHTAYHTGEMAVIMRELDLM